MAGLDRFPAPMVLRAFPPGARRRARRRRCIRFRESFSASGAQLRWNVQTRGATLPRRVAGGCTFGARDRSATPQPREASRGGHGGRRVADRPASRKPQSGADHRRRASGPTQGRSLDAPKLAVVMEEGAHGLAGGSLTGRQPAYVGSATERAFERPAAVSFMRVARDPTERIDGGPGGRARVCSSYVAWAT
jgi:hypothetical protein